MTRKIFRRSRCALLISTLGLSSLFGQAPSAGLIYLQTIPILNWATSGSN